LVDFDLLFLERIIQYSWRDTFFNIGLVKEQFFILKHIVILNRWSHLKGLWRFSTLIEALRLICFHRISILFLRLVICQLRKSSSSTICMTYKLSRVKGTSCKLFSIFSITLRTLCLTTVIFNSKLLWSHALIIWSVFSLSSNEARIKRSIIIDIWWRNLLGRLLLIFYFWCIWELPDFILIWSPFWVSSFYLIKFLAIIIVGYNRIDIVIGSLSLVRTLFLVNRCLHLHSQIEKLLLLLLLLLLLSTHEIIRVVWG
jgi:hypothetical protein